MEDSLSEVNFPPLVQALGKASASPSLPQNASPSPQWRHLFQQAHRTDERLSFHEPRVENGMCIVEPPDEVFDAGVKAWSNTLVGYFVGKRVPFKIVKELLEKKWGKWGNFQVISGDNGNYLFRFNSSTACDLVLSNGPWEVWGAYLALRRWEEGMTLCKNSFSSIPVWVKLSNVPLELWTRPGLSYIASALGVPLCMDAATSAGNRLSFARVCVEMKASSSFPNSFKVRRRSGILADVFVQYVWKPSVCSVCKVFDHSSKQYHLVDSKTVQVEDGYKDEQVPISQGPTAKPTNDCLSEEFQGEASSHGPEETGSLLPKELNLRQDVTEKSSDEATLLSEAAHPDVITLGEKVKDPITPLKPVPEPVIRPTPLDPMPPDSNFRYVEGSGKKSKKKRDSSRRGLSTPR
ncbi:DUF4283 domain-containing protein [Cephalotus follicularis]|uniref:DUF4283 domain-containing protein n=1 Tax=Cephalotus follicularis TaxID=3775 RepID=A0A1Q3DHR5_CEPFO|nr:DUF4283 domain-containing protein [Cephalotus follicularis]